MKKEEHMGWLLLIIGIVIGFATTKFWEHKNRTGLRLKTWHYLLSAVLIAWAVVGTVFAYDCFTEGEIRAGWFFVLLHWGIAIVVALLAIGFERRRLPNAA